MSPIGSVPSGSTGATPAPPPSGGQVPNVYVTGFERFVALPGFVRLDIEISGGDAYVQINESLDRTWEEPSGHEILLREGANSIPLVRTAYGYRVRAASTSTGVTFNARTFG